MRIECTLKGWCEWNPLVGFIVIITEARVDYGTEVQLSSDEKSLDAG